MQIKLTETGKDLLLESLTGAFGITFSAIVIGNGDGSAATDSISNLVNPLRTLSITECEVHDNFAEISASLTNAGVENQINVTEIGVMAIDPTLNDTPVLFAYLYTPEESAIIIPSASDYVLETVLKVDVYVSSAENISAIINESLAYPTKAEFQEHLNDRGNPHRVTKDQVGLSEVPNVSTNDQTPTFNIASTLEEINSSETMSVIMGKIKKALNSLISHIGNKTNPHGVTAAQAGAAATIHTHNASDINAGTLGVARGGTGLGSVVTERLLAATGTNIIGQLARSSGVGNVLKQNPSGAPYWGANSEAGTYVGSNTVGASNPNSILFFGCSPKFVFIADNFGVSSAWAFLIITDNGGIGWSFWGEDSKPLAVSKRVVNNSTIVEWYAISSGAKSSNQMNYDHTYYYVGIG